MKKRVFSICFFLSYGYFLLFSKDNKPNIVFILADDLGYADLGYQGSKIMTHNIDNLANDGIILDRCYSQPQSTPSRFALMTGMYPYNYGFHEHIVADFSSHGIPSELETLPERLKKEGYKTAIFGKWHLGLRRKSYSSNYNGFDYFFGCNGGSVSYWNYSATGQVDLNRNGEKIYPESLDNNEESGNTYFTDRLTDEAISYISEQDKDNPFFLYMSYTSPHSPFQVPQKFIDKYSGVLVDKKNRSKNKNNPYLLRYTYMGMIDNLDNNIGKIINELKKKDLYDNTLIVFCSDNGGVPIAGDNGVLSGFKGSSLEGGIRVPAFVVWPSIIKKGTRTNELLHFTDWYPTLIEAVSGNLNLGYKLDGISALQILKGGKSKREYIPIISSNEHALITPKWSLVLHSDCNYHLLLSDSINDKYCLYDLENDISQKNNVLDDNKNIGEYLKKKLLEHISRSISGQFNWDINVARFYLPPRIGDHYCDWQINDLPIVKTFYKNGRKYVSISPVSKELSYSLFASNDRESWTLVDSYKSESDGEEYIFRYQSDFELYNYFEVKSNFHYGIPGCETFDIGKGKVGYNEGSISSTQGSIKRFNVGEYKAGFLPCCDIDNGVNIFVKKGNLVDASPKGMVNDGYLQMNTNSLLTKYFAKVHTIGEYFISVDLILNKQKEGDTVNVILSRNIGGMGALDDFPFLTFSIENNNIYVDVNGRRSFLSVYDQSKLKLVVGLNLRTIGKDIVSLFINPIMKNDVLPTADFVTKGEFTFDKLTFKNYSKNNNYVPLKLDNISVSLNWSELVSINKKD